MNKFSKILMAGLLLGSSAALAQTDATLRTNTGAPVANHHQSQTVGAEGPVLLQDINLVEKLASFDRERIPERVVHARGVGAYGEFESYGDQSQYTRAYLFSKKGLKTPVFVRFSTVVHSSGSPETLRDPRGFATKFYTPEGNYDLVGNHLPVFFIRDAKQFPDMVHAFKPSPVLNKQDPHRVFDFLSHVPESTHMLTWLYSNNGTPASYRQMDGFGIHTFKWVNAKGEVHYVRYTWRSLQGVKNLNPDEAMVVQGKDFQHATVDLYQHIKDGKFPSWELQVQLLKPEDLAKFSFNPLDPTKVWPEKLIPVQKVGKMTLNRVPGNYFEDVEQSAFSPGSFVPGIEASEDKLLQGRLFSYFDTQRHRLGANFQKIPVNCPYSARTQAVNYNQDGDHRTGALASDVNYYPSASTEALPKEATEYPLSSMTYSGATVQQVIGRQQNFAQAGELYRSFSAEDKTWLVKNLAGDLAQVRNEDVLYRMLGHFYAADTDYGTRLAAALKADVAKVKMLADALVKD